MAMNPNDIHVSQEDKQVLAVLVDRSQKELSVALREAVNAYLEHLSLPSKPNGNQTSDNNREQAFLRAAGSWTDVDTDALLEENYEQRLRSTRDEPQL
jgi:hypothetical protein